MNEIEAKIADIVRKIKCGYVFDSHYVIDTLIKDYSGVYLRYVARHIVENKTTEYAHSAIAKLIKKNRGLVHQITDKSWSYNIHHKQSSCVLWQRLGRSGRRLPGLAI